jgi:hypothetical protein
MLIVVLPKSQFVRQLSETTGRQNASSSTTQQLSAHRRAQTERTDKRSCAEVICAELVT